MVDLRMVPLAEYVFKSLASLSEAFLPDELAYLALTQKIEHAIRDKLAFKLHQAFAEKTGLLVCREWNRTDIAIIEDDHPRLLLEAKAIYTFDIIKSGAQHSYPGQLERDIEKAQRWVDATAPNVPEILALLLATHLHDPPGQEYRQAIKYFGGVTKYTTAENTVALADQAIRKRLQLPIVAHGEINGGSAFGIRVSVAYWLVQPKTEG